MFKSKKYMGISISFIMIIILLINLMASSLNNNSLITNNDEQVAKEFLKERHSTKNKIIKKKNGKKFRIAYVDIDPYPLTGEMLYYFIKELKNNGLIEYKGKLPFDPQNTDAKKLINYLASKDLGPYIEFSSNANYYLAIDGEEECKESLLEHIKKKEIDLIFCMGTWPGLFVKNLGITDVPVMLYTSIDPVGSGFAKSKKDSGQDNLWAHVKYSIFNKQLQLYYDTFQFQNIGVIYYDEKIAAMPAYRQVARQNHFSISEEVIQNLVGDSPQDIENYYKTLKKLCVKLIKEKKIDAFMIGTDIFKNEKLLKNYLDIFYEYDIPVFVQNGEFYLNYGATMIVTTSNTKEQAPFIVETLIAIINGEKPRSLVQEFIISPYVSINIEACEKINYQPEIELLISTEKVYGGGQECE